MKDWVKKWQKQQIERRLKDRNLTARASQKKPNLSAFSWASKDLIVGSPPGHYRWKNTPPDASVFPSYRKKSS